MVYSRVNFTCGFTITYLSLVPCNVCPTRTLPNSYVIFDIPIAGNVAFIMSGGYQSSLMDVHSTLKLTAAYLSEM